MAFLLSRVINYSSFIFIFFTNFNLFKLIFTEIYKEKYSNISNINNKYVI